MGPLSAPVKGAGGRQLTATGSARRCLREQAGRVRHLGAPTRRSQPATGSPFAAPVHYFGPSSAPTSGRRPLGRASPLSRRLATSTGQVQAVRGLAAPDATQSALGRARGLRAAKPLLCRGARPRRGSSSALGGPSPPSLAALFGRAGARRTHARERGRVRSGPGALAVGARRPAVDQGRRARAEGSSRLGSPRRIARMSCTTSSSQPTKVAPACPVGCSETVAAALPSSATPG